MIPIAAALLLSAAPLPVTRVDFHLAGQGANPRPTSAAPGAIGAPFPLAPPVSPVASVTAGEEGDREAVPVPAKPHFFIARGFGHQVPLAFAVRQVVPAHVRVSYGEGVDGQQLVNWTGGKPWDDVLRSAVKPLGLHLVMSTMAVRIVE